MQFEQRPSTKDMCGFVCPSCNFRLLLSDVRVCQKIIDCFTNGAESASSTCPECGQEHSYTRFDLTIFLPHGKERRATPARREQDETIQSLDS